MNATRWDRLDILLTNLAGARAGPPGMITVPRTIPKSHRGNHPTCGPPRDLGGDPVLVSCWLIRLELTSPVRCLFVGF